MLQNLIIVIAAYLVGAIPFSYIISYKFGGVDIRKKGSGNVGATNVLRNLGWKMASVALTGDLIKGFAAACLGMYFNGPIWAVICGIAAIIGHCWPIFLKFRGGKGVATTAGVILFLMPEVVLGLAVVFTTTIAITRYVSLGSIMAALSFPFLVLLFHRPGSYLIMSIFLSLLVLYKHRANMQRILKGNESKIGHKAGN